MMLCRDEEALLEQLAALAREEEADVLALESQLEPIEVCTERVLEALAQREPGVLVAPSVWERMRRKLHSWYCLPMLLSVSAAMVLCLNLPHFDGRALDPKPPAYRLSVLTAPHASALRAGSQVKLLLSPLAETTVVPRAEVAFDDGQSLLQCDSDTVVDPDGSLRLLVALPERAGQLRIRLEHIGSAGSPEPVPVTLANSAGRASCATEQAWSLPVQLASAPAAHWTSELTPQLKPRAVSLSPAH